MEVRILPTYEVVANLGMLNAYAALFVILFIYGWNQYLWPLLITTDKDIYTIVMGIKQMLEAVEEAPEWHLIMMTALLAQIPPVAVVLSMQKLFVKGLIETEK